MYSDPAHFIYELIQNAEDAGANKIRFALDGDAVRVSHNGRQFEFKDIDSITASGDSTKDGVNTIGRFGVGFKSVFAVSDCPEIHSGKYHFRIKNFIVPSRVSSESRENTEICILLKPDKREELREKIAKQLRALRGDAMLFLSGIKSLKWQDGEESGACEREEKQAQGCGSGLEVVPVTLRASGELPTEERYLLFRRKVKISGKSVQVACAYLLKDDAIEQVKKPLSVYFPTKEEAGLAFVLQIPYRTTPNRETIDFDFEENRQLTKAAATLTADSLPVLRDRGLLSADFVTGVLPLDASDTKHQVYRAAFAAIKEKLKSDEKLLPRTGGGHVTAKDAILGDNDLRELLSAEQAKELFGRGEWLDLPGNLSSYLQSHLDIPNKNYNDFTKIADRDFFVAQNDEWMTRFYGQLANRWYLPVKKNLESKSLIRLECGAHVAPTGECVYLPVEGDTRFKIVKRCFINDTRAARFFREILKLEKPRKVAEVKELIAPRYRGGGEISDGEHIKDIHAILAAEKENCAAVKEALKNRAFIKTCDGVYRKLDECYFADEKLRCWFADNPAAGFVDDAFYLAVLESGWEDAFERLGVSRAVRVLCNEQHKSHDPYRSHEIAVGNFNPNFSIAGFDFALQRMSLARSKIAWDLAIEYHNQLSGRVRQSSNLKHLYNAESQLRISTAGKMLRQFDWLFDKNDKLINRSCYGEITEGDLHPDYNRDNIDAVRELARFLGLKPDIDIAQIERAGLKVVQEAEYKKFRMWQERKRREESEKDDDAPDWKPRMPACAVKIKEITPPACSQKGDIDNGPRKVHKGEEQARNGPSPKNATAIGKWAEEYAGRYLCEEYPESDGYAVEALNDSDKQGVGYDFCVKRNGKSVLYVEVKGTTKEAADYVDVSVSQWNAAQAHGDKYLIVAVKNVGKDEAAHHLIPNPAQKFADGEIEASPVRIRI